MSRQAWFDALLDLFFPGSQPCAFCWQKVEGQKEGAICADCSKKVLELSERLPSCPRCGFFTSTEPCPNCYDRSTTLSGVFSVVPYEGIYREKVYGLKYNGEKKLAAALGALMARRIEAAGLKEYFDLLIPLPLHPLREEERGYNQSLLLAGTMSRELGIPCEHEVLARQVYEESQTKFGRKKRRRNMRGTFVLRSGERVKGKKVLLVDDIITSGSTMEAAAATVCEGGTREVSGVTWAAGIDKYLNKEAGSIHKISK